MQRAKYKGSNGDFNRWKELLVNWDDWFAVSAFEHPKLIIYDNVDIYTPRLAHWGLIPDWAEDKQSIWNKTLNARGESLFEKPAFKTSAGERRCLIPAEGYYEYHDFRGKKYPFYITRKDRAPMYFAGLWNEWGDPETGEVLNTCSIVTTQANSLLQQIHNKPKASDDQRMPVILPDQLCNEWLKPLSQKEVEELAVHRFSDSELEAWSVRKLSGNGSLGNVPEANEKYEYPELHWGSKRQSLLF